MARLFDFCRTSSTEPEATEPEPFTAAGMWRRLVIPASPPSRPGFFWLELPSDVAEIIIRHMPRRTLRALSQCCSSYAEAVREEEWAATGDDNDLFLLRLAVAGYAVLRSALPAVTSHELAALKRRSSKPVFNAYDSEQKSTAVGDGKRRVVELKLQGRPDLSLELSSAYARALWARGALAAAAMGEDKYVEGAVGVLAKANCAMQPAHGDHAKPNAFIAMPAGDVPLSLLHAMEAGSTLMVYPDGCTSTTGVELPDAWRRVKLAPMDAVVLCGDYPHSGDMYTQTNMRGHSYVLRMSMALPRDSEGHLISRLCAQDSSDEDGDDED